MERILIFIVTTLVFSNFSFSQLYPFLAKTGKYGFANKEMKLVIPSNFDYAMPFIDGFAPVKIGMKYGVINEEAKIIVPYKYDQIDIVGNFFRVRIGNVYGFFKKDGAILTPIKYYSVDSFLPDGLCRVFANTSHPNCINSQGKELIPAEYYFYDKVNDFLLVENRTTKKKGVINAKGEFVITANCDNIEIVDSSFFKLTYNKSITFFPRKSELENAAKMLTKLVKEFPVKDEIYYNGCIAYKSVDRMGLLNENLEPLTDEKYYKLEPFKNGLWLYMLPNSYKIGIMNNKGEEIVPAIYDQIESSDFTNFIRARINDKWGAINEKFEDVVPFDFKYIVGGGKYFVHAKKESKWLIINVLNEIVGEFDREPIHNDFFNCFVVWDGKTNNTYDLNGKLILQNHGSILRNSKSMMIYINNEWKLTDFIGQPLNNSVYKEPYSFLTPGVFEAYLGEKYIYIDEDGNEYYER